MLVTRSLHLFNCEHQKGPSSMVPKTAGWSEAWTEDNWEQILFRDGFRFRLDSDSRRVLIWREPESLHRFSNIVEKDHYG
ncbi:hypothetical protein TNCV_3613771 [Trichonephila clavipes]|uniref:Uncharacterized protein n=1 Tax=Trichonephila clavipes TaxID=2585209 RepID=A0A8X6SMK3_TRICX|nr:hypothetical protein TNCV_3613771 [Trichonephila clavipes]